MHDGAQPPRSALAPKSLVSAVTLPDAWFIACSSRELRARPIARTVQNVPLVLFRTGDGQPAALVDRCPHRNVPLSLGRVRGQALECRYHGWQFDRQGTCVCIPGLVAEVAAKSRNATAYACREQQGYVWVYSTPNVEPADAPYLFPFLDDRRYSTIRRDMRVQATVHAAVENALDVPHTAFLHGGLFRTEKKTNEIEVVVRRSADRVEAEYIGEPRPGGLAARLLAPGGGVVTHFDRFLLPSIAQVEYRLGDDSHLLATSVMTPITETETHLWAVLSFRVPIPSWLVRLVLTPVGLRIFRQDAEMLAAQTENIRRFGGEQFASTEIDVLGPQVLRLLKQKSRGEAGEQALFEHRVRMRT